MDTVLDDVVPIEDLKKFESQYNAQFNRGHVNPKTQFEYAWCLVRSIYAADNRKGIYFLEELIKNGEEEAKRDYLYYLAVGNARIKEYNTALMYLDKLLTVEPANKQAQDLAKTIKRRMQKEGLMGIALVGGAIGGVCAIVGLGFALAKRH